MHKIFETISFWLKCLRAHYLFWRMDIGGLMKKIDEESRKQDKR